MPDAAIIPPPSERDFGRADSASSKMTKQLPLSVGSNLRLMLSNVNDLSLPMFIMKYEIPYSMANAWSILDFPLPGGPWRINNF